jgi:hypothetical protein
MYMTTRLHVAIKGVPAALAAQARDIMKRGTCVKAKRDEGTIAATCRAMEDQEARDIAKAIVQIYDEVCRLKAVDKHKRESK